MLYQLTISWLYRFSSFCDLLVLVSSPRTRCFTTVFVFEHWMHWPLMGGLCQSTVAAWITHVMTSRSSSPVDWDRVSEAVSSLRQSRGVVLAWRCVRIPFRTARTWWRRWHIQIFDVFDADYINVTNRDLKSDWVPDNNINFHEHPSTVHHYSINCHQLDYDHLQSAEFRWNV